MNASEITEQLSGHLTVLDLLFPAGVAVLVIWLIKTSLGRKALWDSPGRPNNLPVYMPFAPLFIWFFFVAAAMTVTARYLSQLAEWKQVFMNNLFLLGGAVIAGAVAAKLGRRYFLDGLRGLGIKAGGIPKDLLSALLSLLAVWPVVALAIALTIKVGQAIFGSEFQIQQHQELMVLTEYHQTILTVLVVIVTVIAAPVFEEMLFRGLLQSTILSHTSRPWLTIFITSAIFAFVHPNPQHWPGLFVLGVGLGYSYEKSGSLFRPIFMHSTFNAVVVATIILYGRS